MLYNRKNLEELLKLKEELTWKLDRLDGDIRALEHGSYHAIFIRILDAASDLMTIDTVNIPQELQHILSTSSRIFFFRRDDKDKVSVTGRKHNHTYTINDNYLGLESRLTVFGTNGERVEIDLDRVVRNTDPRYLKLEV